jgi:hypothetical protein
MVRFLKIARAVTAGKTLANDRKSHGQSSKLKVQSSRKSQILLSQTVTIFSLLILLTACNRRFEVGEKFKDFVSANGNMVFSVERYFEVEESNNEGRIIKGLKVEGVRLIEGYAIPLLTNGIFFVVDQPLTTGLLRSRYLERRNQRSKSASAPIRFLDYQTAWVITVDRDGLIRERQKKDFGYITIQLSDSAFLLP